MKPISRIDDADLNLLLALEALLDEQHVTRAAKRIGLTQPSMSHALGRLRTLFNDNLFVRSARGIVPTERAKQLSGPLQRILGELRELLSDPTFDPTTSRRAFQIATPDFGQLLLLPPLLERIRSEAPHVRIGARAAPADHLALLESGELDLVIGPTRVLPPGLHKQTLISSRQVCIGRREHPQLGPNLSLAAFAALPHIKMSFRAGLGAPIDAALRERKLAPHFMLELSDLIVAMFVAARSDLVVIGGELLARAFEGLLPLQAVAVPVAGAANTVSQIWHARQHEDPAHIWLRHMVKDIVPKPASRASSSP